MLYTQHLLEKARAVFPNRRSDVTRRNRVEHTNREVSRRLAQELSTSNLFDPSGKQRRGQTANPQKIILSSRPRHCRCRTCAFESESARSNLFACHSTIVTAVDHARMQLSSGRLIDQEFHRRNQLSKIRMRADLSAVPERN